MDDLLLDALISIMNRIRETKDKEKRVKALRIFYEILGLLLVT